MRRRLALNVFDAALERLAELYRAGDRIVVSFSAGKDSGICLELAILAATSTSRLPVDVVMRDDEVMFPGTFEYAERVAKRHEIRFRWLVAQQPIVNVFNRVAPYFWAFDPLLPPDAWVRTPPALAEFIPEKAIQGMVTPERFTPDPGKLLISVIGLRVQESRRRGFAIASARGHLTKPSERGVRHCYPIYDWTDGDVWRAIRDNKFDYNGAYDVMARLGVPRTRLRIAPPTLNQASAEQLQVAVRAWPAWFERVARRLQGVRAVALFGRRSVTPTRRMGETWEECYQRECIDEAPAWISERARLVAKRYRQEHVHHSTTPFPDVEPCASCTGGRGVASWRLLTMTMWNGDPFCMKITPGRLPYVEPEFFRPGAGTWGGRPTF